MTSPSEPRSLWQHYRHGSRTGEEIVLEFKKLNALFHGLVYLLCWSMSMSVQVFLHYRFGERYLRLLQATIATCIIMLVGYTIPAIIIVKEAAPPPAQFTFFDAPQAEPPRGPDSTFGHAISGLLSLLHILLMGVAIVIHQRLAMRRRKQNIRWYSRSSGLFWPIWGRVRGADKPGRVESVYEPALCAIPGIVLLASGVLYGLVLLMAAVAIIVKGQIEMNVFRERLLDMVDQQIESEHMSKALSGQSSPEETEGLVMPGAGTWSPSEQETIAAAYKKVEEQLGIPHKPVPEPSKESESQNAEHPAAPSFSDHSSDGALDAVNEPEIIVRINAPAKSPAEEGDA